MAEIFTNKEIKQLIKQLKEYEIRVQDVPEELRFNRDIIEAERKYGLRKSHYRGYDIITNIFFVEEVIFYKNFLGEVTNCSTRVTFESFEDYYEYLDGDIYDMACYQYYDFDNNKPFVNKKNIHVEKLKSFTAFTQQTIDDYFVEISQEELDQYEEAEKTKKLCKKWVAKFNGCVSCDELKKMVKNYEKSKTGNKVDVAFFFMKYIFFDITDKERFKVIMEYMSTGEYPEDKLIKALCSIYSPDDVIDHYDYSSGAKRTIYKYKKKLKDYVGKLKNGDITFMSRTFFDEKTHYFCEEVAGFEDDNRRRPIMSYQRYFETFEEFIEHRKGSLKASDLSKAIKLNVDFLQYETDERTILPLGNSTKIVTKVHKHYRNGMFYVEKRWENENGYLVKKKEYSTLYFFDFIYFLKGDLSDADLLFCDGLANIPTLKGINLDGAKMTSSLCDKFGVGYETYKLQEDVIESFALIQENEKNTSLWIKKTENSELISTDNSHSMALLSEWEGSCQRVHYITDIHLMHRLKNAKCKSKNDVLYVMQNIVNNIANEAGSLLLIGGDVALEFSIFKLFIGMLKQKLENRQIRTEVVFILGNHELWSFSGKSIEEISDIYRKHIEENGMHFIQNDLLYEDYNNKLCRIEYSVLSSLDVKQLRNQLRSTRLVIFGGTGFSGYNEEFNANNGIYRSTINRTKEQKETAAFESLYNSLIPVIYDKNVIIFTHMPKKDWCRESDYQNGFVYVSGHTHRNDFYDDGEYRYYGDNQVGYRNNNPYLKSFYMDNEYDSFSDYEDGIYEISRAQYKDFYRGKNILMNFTREVNILYMLKKNGFYCFIHELKTGSLTILNGGALKRLDGKDIQYYYNHMDEVVSYIKKPLDQYTKIQQAISKEIIKLGGSGKIHGCIIDVDFYNHVYVNPIDLTITSYWALDMINKIVYPNVPALLQAQCPLLYSNYLKLIEGKKKNVLMPKKTKSEVARLPQEYLYTDIYKASREIKKMQKLSSNILCSWYELQNGCSLIEKK